MPVAAAPRHRPAAIASHPGPVQPDEHSRGSCPDSHQRAQVREDGREKVLPAVVLGRPYARVTNTEQPAAIGPVDQVQRRALRLRNATLAPANLKKLVYSRHMARVLKWVQHLRLISCYPARCHGVTVPSMKAMAVLALVCLGCGALAGGGETETNDETEVESARPSDDCEVGTTRCAGESFERCVETGAGESVWVLELVCPGLGFCSPDSGCLQYDAGILDPCSQSVTVFWSCSLGELTLCPAFFDWDRAETCDTERLCEEGYDACRP